MLKYIYMYISKFMFQYLICIAYVYKYVDEKIQVIHV